MDLEKLDSLEDLCVTWGGYVHGIELVNTRPMDNFVTLLSLHRDRFPQLSTSYNPLPIRISKILYH